jgi:hypothetical protein
MQNVNLALTNATTLAARPSCPSLLGESRNRWTFVSHHSLSVPLHPFLPCTNDLVSFVLSTKIMAEVESITPVDYVINAVKVRFGERD